MRLPRPAAGVIFDLDGVLLDTEHFYTEVTQEICGGYGKVFDWSIKRNMIGRPSLESAQYLVEALSLPITPQEYLKRRGARLEELFAGALEQPGAERFTRALCERRVPIAVATSSERRLFELKTGRHGEWFGCFGAVVVGDDPRVKAGKPAPDIFLVAASELGIEPSRCVVFEDAPAGLQAARAAGMMVVALPDPAMDRAPYESADLVIDSFDQITPEDLGL
ncbi:MAG TPA: HAD-IA family hydrolase [Candidatus Limnocylindrales bacterium]|nr:HAD-IA family hydrolase [Candidatus Limnocylindrales bacterium]